MSFGVQFAARISRAPNIEFPKAWDCADLDDALQQEYATSEMGFRSQVARQQS
jgi:hypothetical protein